MKISSLLAALFLSAASLHAQDVKLEGQAKADVVNTGDNPTFNITNNIIVKSPEYAELKKSLAQLEADIQKKADRCEKYTDPVAKDDCRTELIALNVERDSVQKMEALLREGIIKTAEFLQKIPINSRRLFVADSLIKEGKIREARTILNFEEISQEGDALLAKRERDRRNVHEGDSLLLIKANELALKARLKATDFADLLHVDSAQVYFEQSSRYAETVDNLSAFAVLLYEQNQSQRGICYLEKARSLARHQSEEAILTMRLGVLFYVNQKFVDSEKMYRRSLEIFEQLAKSDSIQFEPYLAETAMNLGILYFEIQKMEDSQKMFLLSIEIQERLAKANPKLFEPNLAKAAANLGIYYQAIQKMGDAEKMYLFSLEIMERLAKADSARFEPDLARAAMNLGIFYQAVNKMEDAEKMYFIAMEIQERFVKLNPDRFEPDLALTLNNFGHFRMVLGKLQEAKNLYGRGLALRREAVENGQSFIWDELNRVYLNMASLRDSFEARRDYKSLIAIQQERAVCMESLLSKNPTAAKNVLQDFGLLGKYCLFARQNPEAQAAAEHALGLDASQNWVRTNLGHSQLLRGDWPAAKATYEIYVKNEKDPAEAKTTLAKDLTDLEAAGITCPEMAKARAWLRE